MADITKRKLTSLKKLPDNPRNIRAEDMAVLVDSLARNPELFDARPIILSDRTGELVIIAGNMRFEAAKSLGLREVPTILLPGLTEAKEREIAIRDNINNGDWDWDILANQWDDLPLGDWGLEMPSFDAIDDLEVKGDEKESEAKEPQTCPHCGGVLNG
jgi:ParB-like chromosome segregation protein Spo0J